MNSFQYRYIYINLFVANYIFDSRLGFAVKFLLTIYCARGQSCLLYANYIMQYFKTNAVGTFTQSEGWKICT